VLRDLLGHRSVNTTSRYLHSRDDERRAVLARRAPAGSEDELLVAPFVHPVRKATAEDAPAIGRMLARPSTRVRRRHARPGGARRARARALGPPQLRVLLAGTGPDGSWCCASARRSGRRISSATWPSCTSAGAPTPGARSRTDARGDRGGAREGCRLHGSRHERGRRRGTRAVREPRLQQRARPGPRARVMYVFEREL